MTHGSSPRQRWTGGRENKSDDQEGSHDQKEKVPETESVLVDPGGISKILDRREVDRGRFPTGEEVKQNRNCRECETGEDPRSSECDHATDVAWTRACRNAIPKGVSVVITS
jgi:hypothetical protein